MKYPSIHSWKILELPPESFKDLKLKGLAKLAISNYLDTQYTGNVITALLDTVHFYKPLFNPERCMSEAFSAASLCTVLLIEHVSPSCVSMTPQYDPL